MLLQARNGVSLLPLHTLSQQHIISFQGFKSATHHHLHCLLQRCTTMKVLNQIHAQLVTNGLHEEMVTIGKLIGFCAVSEGGDLSYAHKVFDGISKPNRFMWNSLIRGYSNSDRPREALFLHRRMLGAGRLPNEFTLPFVLKSCAFESASTETSSIHELIIKLGFRSQVFVQNSLINAYVACGFIGIAQRVFDEISSPNVVSWNSMIGGHSQLGSYEEAFKLFKKMRFLNLQPDKFTLVSLFSVCSKTGSLELGKLVHHYLEITGINIDLIMGNALIDMYAKCGDLKFTNMCFNRNPMKDVVTWTSMVSTYAREGLHDMARCWFDKMTEKNVITWNSMISCYVQHGQCHEALNLYKKMQHSGVQPDEATLTSVLSACSQVGDLIMGNKIHDHLCRTNMNPSVPLLNSLINMYAKCGCISFAFDIFSKMREKSLVSWNVMISAFAMHGRASDAISLFEIMNAIGVSPDDITFVAVLSACSHGGLLDDGLTYFNNMQNVYKVQPQIHHYACMIDLFGRLGDLKKAIGLINIMPMKPDIVIWGAILGACRMHGNANIGKAVMKQLLDSEPCNGGLFVLASNMYYEADRLGDGKKVWKYLRESGIRKITATSLIEIDGDTHEFMVEDKRHRNSSEIYYMLRQLSDNLRTVQSTLDLLFTISDE